MDYFKEEDCIERGPMQHIFSLVRFVPVCLLIPGMVFAASAVGKVRHSIGDVQRQKAEQKDWSALKVGSKIFQTDFVRTGAESVVGINFTDGTSINIGENTEVEMSNLFEEIGTGAYRTRLNIKKGFVDFDVKKLIKESTFQFKTGTATASIRGTSGFIGGEDGAFYASLATGKFDIQQKDDGPVMPVVAGETMFGTDSLVTMKLKSSGDKRFAKKLAGIVKKNAKNVQSMMKEVKDADEAHQKALLENNFAITTKSPANVCNEGLTVDGSYTASDPKASLVMMIGKSYTSDNLIRATDGKKHSFSQKVSVNDANKLWTENQVTFVFKAAGNTETQTIEMDVNKTCAQVNQVSPAIKFLSYDSIACNMHVSFANMQDDAGILTMSVDGTPVAEEPVTKNEQKKYKLTSGEHVYTFALKDQAGNDAVFEKRFGCYSVKRFNIDVYGKAKEEVKVPPPPVGMQDRITKTLRFKIKNPENDPVFLHKVTIKQNGKVILQETLGQIQSLDYQVPVNLVRGAQNRFDIEVVHKSGFKAKAQKVFEVR